MTHRQLPETLPVSCVTGNRFVASRALDLRPINIIGEGNHKYKLADGWRLYSDKDKSTVYNAVVPGTVLTSLVEAGVFPDPYFGLNNLEIPDTLCRTDWWYTLDFDAPQSLADGEAWLDFDGINYIAEIELNDVRLGEMKGAFVRGSFNVTEVLREKDNKLKVKIRPPYNPGIPHEQSPSARGGGNGGFLCLDGPTFISSEGWDWIPGIRDRNIGIWQDVTLKYTGGVKLMDPQIVTRLELPDTTRATVSVSAVLENLRPHDRKVSFNVKFDGREINQEVTLAPMQKLKVELSPEDHRALCVDNPRLWWPNGYGAQNLYNMELSITDGGKVVDVDSVRFGIREFSYDLTAGYPGDSLKRISYRPVAVRSKKPVFNTSDRQEVIWGMTVPRVAEDVDADVVQSVDDPEMEQYLVVNVNGKRIFCRGGNWGMDDGMKRVTRERLEPYFRLHKEANFNMVRNWTGESTEKLFYDLCDEYGMLVFNDFWISTQNYNHEPIDDDLFLRNAEDVVVRFRNHPSIVIWNPRNEGYAPEYIDKALAAMIAREDGTRHYTPNSTHCNLRPSGPWNYYKDKGWYYRERVFGFNTEQGTTSIPTRESILAMMAPVDAWPVSDVWYYHDFHDGQIDFVDDMTEKFGAPESLDDFCRKAQILCYDAHRVMLEAAASKMWNSASGLLLWMSHPAWPSMVWQAYSSDYETMGSFYGCRKACEPVHIQLSPADRTVTVVNTTIKPLENLTATYSRYSPDGKLVASRSVNTGVAENCAVTVFEQPLPSGEYEAGLERLRLTDRKGNELSVNDYLVPGSDGSMKAFNSLPAPRIKAKLSRKGNITTVTLRNAGTVPAISLKLNVRDEATGERVLPAYASEGYFNLLPGESRVVTIECDTEVPVYISAEGYNLESVRL